MLDQIVELRKKLVSVHDQVRGRRNELLEEIARLDSQLYLLDSKIADIDAQYPKAKGV